MKELLIISLQYYPLNSPCAHRIHSYGKHLHDFGYRSTILCMDWRFNSSKEMPKCAERYDLSISKPDVCRTERIQLNHIWQYSFALGYCLRPLSWPAELYMKFLIHAQKMHKELNFDAILATSPMQMPLAVASTVGRKFKIPWIADLRDVAGELTPQPSNNPLRIAWRHFTRRLVKHQETRVCGGADAVLTVSAPLVDTLLERGLKKVHLVYNGFEPEDYAGEEVNQNRLFRILYGGTITPSRNPSMLFEAVDLLLKRELINPDDFQICFFGKIHLPMNEILRNRPCRKIVKIYDRIARCDFIEALKNSTILLQLAHPHEKGIMTSKIFDYLAVSHPILSIPKDNDVIDALLSETNAGKSFDNHEGVMDYLLHSYRQWKAEGRVKYEGNHNAISLYTRGSQTKKLAHILDSVLNTSNSSNIRQRI